jgi:hypothetical protein
VHTPPYQPEGRGKIERFFRSVREQFLASLDPKALLSLEQLNERLWHWLDAVYHRREHGALQTTPLLRWQRDIDRIRQLPPATDLRRLFFHRVDRLVRRDSTFLLHNRFFEAPSHLAGQRIEVRFDPLDPERVEIYHAGQPAGAGKSTAARVFTAALNPNLHKVLYVHFSSGIALDLLRQIAMALDLQPAHFRGDLVRQIADAVVRLNQSKKQHPILICDEAHLLPHPAPEQLPLWLNFDMDS